jgi:hypothetical protein
VGTRSSQGDGSGGVSPKQDNTVPALKAALLAAAAAIAVLVLVIGLAIFLMKNARMRGNDAPKRGKKSPGAGGEDRAAPIAIRPSMGQAEWKSRPRYYPPPDRPALPPARARQIQQPTPQSEDADDEEAIWEGEARTEPEAFDLSRSASELPWHARSKQAPLSEQIVQQGADGEGSDLEASGQGAGHQFAEPTLRSPRAPESTSRPISAPPADQGGQH